MKSRGIMLTMETLKELIAKYGKDAKIKDILADIDKQNGK